jgi:hypothetical protein
VVAEGPALKLKNVKDITVEGFTFEGKTTEGLFVDGTRNKAINITSTSINADNTVYAGGASSDVVTLK